MIKLRRVLLVLAASFALVAAGCGDSDDSADDEPTDTTTTTLPGAATSSTTSTSTPAQTSTSAPTGGDEDISRMQTQLNAVGCFTGTVDGIDGPETMAAVQAFQTAKGLDVDGIVGPQTQAALDEAVANAETVCTGGGGGDDGGGDDGGDGGAVGDSTVQLASGSYSAGFTVRSCDTPTETTLTLSAENEASIELDVMATGGTGTLSVSGGTEQDGIELTGDVETVQVGDTGSVLVTGTFTGANLAGEAFTLTGSCL